jgi:PAS domain S-box-containing protein
LKPETVELVKAFIAAVAPALGASLAAWRFFIRPRIVKPAHAFAKRLVATLDKVDEMSVSFGANGGKSLADMIRSTHRDTAITGIRVSWLLDQTDRPMFEQAPDGRNLRINSKFTDAFGYGAVEMLGQQWIRLIHEADRPGFMREWDHALEDVRLFEATVRVVTRSRATQQARIILEPRLHEVTGELLRWLGRIETVSGGQP